MKKANPGLVGGFVVGAVVLLLVGVVALGSGTWLRQLERYVLYFDGSVNGLTVASPVKMRGVEVGSVVEVNAVASQESKEIVNEVVIDVDPDRFKRTGRDVERGRWLKLMLAKGLRARLELQSLVTGQLYVGFDFYPDTEIHYFGLHESYRELPTIPSVSQEVSNTVRALMSRLQELPLERIVDNLDAAISDVRSLVGSPQLKAVISDLDETLDEMRVAVHETGEAARSARTLIEDLDTEVGPIAESAVLALDQARETLVSLDGAVQPGSELRYQLGQTLEELAEAARAIRLLAATVERNPSSVVFGRGAEKSP